MEFINSTAEMNGKVVYLLLKCLPINYLMQNNSRYTVTFTFSNRYVFRVEDW